MFQATRYITWALQFYGKTPYDLATSGIPYVATSELEPVDTDLIDDWAAYAELVDAIAAYNAVSSLEVAPALGTINAVFLAYAAMLSPGDEVLIDLAGPVTLEDHVTLAARATVLTHLNVGYRDHPLQAAFPSQTAGVIVRRGSFIGAGATLLAGTSVGPEAFVAAASLVNRDVAERETVGGVPIRTLGSGGVRL